MINICKPVWIFENTLHIEHEHTIKSKENKNKTKRYQYVRYHRHFGSILSPIYLKKKMNRQRSQVKVSVQAIRYN